MAISNPKKIVVCSVVAGFIGAVALFFFLSDTGPNPPDSKIHLSYSVTVQNPTNTAIANASIHISGAIETSAFQQRTHLRADHPFRIDATQAGPDVLLFQWDVFPPYTTKILTVRTDIDLWKAPRQQAREDLSLYLKSEPFIESDHPRITALAARLKAGDPSETIGNTFAWVREKITYSGYIKRTRGALYAIEHLKGDCTEFATLFIALCRANGVPARLIGGFVCPQSTVLDLGDYHNWAEFFHDGRWHIADPQRNRLMSEQHTYIAFHIVNPSEGDKRPLVSGIEGKGLKVKLNR